MSTKNNGIADSQNDQQSDFEVECNVCKQRLINWTGSTPCCGSIAFLVENDEATSKLSLFASINGEPVKPTVLDFAV
jgi:hypothetical protein